MMRTQPSEVSAQAGKKANVSFQLLERSRKHLITFACATPQEVRAARAPWSTFGAAVLRRGAEQCRVSRGLGVLGRDGTAGDEADKADVRVGGAGAGASPRLLTAQVETVAVRS